MIQAEALVNVKSGNTTEWYTMEELYKLYEANPKKLPSLQDAMSKWHPVKKIVRRPINSTDVMFCISFSDGNDIIVTEDTKLMLWDSKGDPIVCEAQKVHLDYKNYVNSKNLVGIKKVGYLGYLYQVFLDAEDGVDFVCNSVAIV